MLRPYSARSPWAFVAASELSDALDSRPALSLATQRWRMRKRLAAARIVAADRPILIDSFPRSGSSFAYHAFIEANPDCDRRVATHQHRSSQFLIADRLGVPALVLVRGPRDAVVSLLAMGIDQGFLPALSGRGARRCIASALRRYARFHERVLPVHNLVIAGFEEVTQDFGQVISRVNTRFGTNFVPFQHDEKRVAEMLQRLSGRKRHLAPNVDRDWIKAALVETYDASELASTRERAESAYVQMIIRRDAQITRGA
ncbi:MAG: hypothetical protein RIC89_22975 [Pseudomonadales bacterium]